MTNIIKRFITFLRHRWFIRVYLLACLLGALLFFYLHKEEFSTILVTAKLRLIVLSLVPYFIGVGVINPYLQKIAYREIGSTISIWQAFRIFILSRIGNYLPGRVWYAANYYLFSKKLNIETPKIVKNFVMLNMLLFLVGGICCLPIISLFSPAIQKLLIVFVIMMLILIHPRIFRKIFKSLLKEKAVGDFRFGFLIIAGILYLTAYIMLGLSLYLCISAFTTIGYSHLPLVVAATAASLVIGLLAVFAPAGIGVSEGISVAILSQVIPLQIAVMAVVAFRIVIIFIDFNCALISTVSVAIDEKTVKHNLA